MTRVRQAGATVRDRLLADPLAESLLPRHDLLHMT
jgi:hypothetical protein